MNKAVAGVICMTVLISCTPYSKFSTLSEIPAGPPKTDWKKYGAYYEIDDMFIECSYAWSPVVEGPQTRYGVKKRLRILTNDGVKYASVPVPFYAPISKFVISMKDSSGKAVSLDAYAIRAEYRKTGVIVFPKATAGCVLDIYIVFSVMKAVTSFEFAFFEEVPVLRSTFTFSSMNNRYTYAFKTYGEPCQHRVDHSPQAVMGKFVHQVWSKERQLPPPRISHLKNIAETVSRVSLVMRSYSASQVFSSQRDIYSGWNKLSESYTKYLFRPSLFRSSASLKKKTKELTEGSRNAFDKADALLEWAQNNITLNDDDAKSIDPDRVLEKGEGNLWEMTFVLKEMLQQIGCFSDVIVTRGKHRGGFDPEFVTPAVLSVPIVIARCDKKNHVAYPFLRGAKLGEYPASFFDLKGLSLEKGAVATLPEPPARSWNCMLSYRLEIVSDSIAQSVTAEFSDYWAFDLRTDLAVMKKEMIKEYFQKMLTNFGLSNALISCDVQNLEKRGEPLIAQLSFATPGQYIERKGQKLYKLDHLFGSYFSLYDTSRTSRFTIPLDELICERITVPKRPNTACEFHITCDAIDNPLFRVTCEEEENEHEYRFTRNLHIKKGDLSAQQMRLIYTDIQSLRTINESYVLFK
ncbi:MAG: hypothetical protein JXA71_12765 [Chitinispirillaceae bacterium]|nr:hypothetical protein [Chitinispirillaceae bacterium]